MRVTHYKVRHAPLSNGVSLSWSLCDNGRIIVNATKIVTVHDNGMIQFQNEQLFGYDDYPPPNDVEWTPVPPAKETPP